MRLLENCALLGFAAACMWCAAIIPVTAQLLQPEAKDNSASVVIEMEPGSPVATGSHLQFKITARARGYLILLAIDAEGGVKQIFPSLSGDGLPYGATDETNSLKPNSPVAVPDPRNVLGNFELFATTPGPAAAIALVSPVPVQLVSLADLPASTSDVATSVRNVFEMIKDLRIAPRNARAALAAPKWSMVGFEYRVE